MRPLIARYYLDNSCLDYCSTGAQVGPRLLLASSVYPERPRAVPVFSTQGPEGSGAVCMLSKLFRDLCVFMELNIYRALTKVIIVHLQVTEPGRGSARRSTRGAFLGPVPSTALPCCEAGTLTSGFRPPAQSQSLFPLRTMSTSSSSRIRRSALTT